MSGNKVLRFRTLKPIFSNSKITNFNKLLSPCPSNIFKNSPISLIEFKSCLISFQFGLNIDHH